MIIFNYIVQPYFTQILYCYIMYIKCNFYYWYYLLLNSFDSMATMKNYLTHPFYDDVNELRIEKQQ